ncbi:MAG: DJ-1/PfpI family protein [Actinobacteria bacterium]|nr:DJ-1/PfpI family protein [Actinomycetota bacterium]
MKATKAAALLLSLAMLALSVVSCGNAGESPAPPQPAPLKENGTGTPPAVQPSSGDTVLMVVCQDGFQDIEYNTVRGELAAAGYKVSVAAPQKATASGVSGTSVAPDLALAEAHAAGYLAVVFIGGPGTDSLFDNEDAHRLAMEAAEGGKVLAAICLAPAILARAGLLAGKRATSYPSASGYLTTGGADYTGSEVEVDGNVITASGPDASHDFAQAIIDALR